MTEDTRPGWTQWREGDNLHEVKPSPSNDWQTLHTTYIGWFSPLQIKSRQMAGKLFAEKFLSLMEESIPGYREMVGKK